jgi:hypothetical protein
MASSTEHTTVICTLSSLIINYACTQNDNFCSVIERMSELKRRFYGPDKRTFYAYAYIIENDQNVSVHLMMYCIRQMHRDFLITLYVQSI